MSSRPRSRPKRMIAISPGDRSSNDNSSGPVKNLRVDLEVCGGDPAPARPL